jgi:hypothetical protein
MSKFDTVLEKLQDARGIAWDGCHKIYILMDNEQVRLMHEYEYEHIFTSQFTSDEEMYRILMDWYEESCGLRFIQAVSTNHDNPNAGFETLIEQGE